MNAPSHAPPVHVARARSQFEALMPKLGAVPDSKTKTVTLDLRLVALAGQRLLNTISEPKIHHRLTRLPAELFLPHLLDEFKKLADVLWYLKEESIRAEVRFGRRQIPPDVAMCATELKNRMLRLTEYHLSKHPGVMLELKMVRSGRGYIHLATGLEILAQIVHEHEATLRHDRVNYRPDDRAEAMILAEQIQKAIGGGVR